MRVIKMVVAAAMVVAVALAIQRNILPRYHCSAEKKRAELWMESARESESLERRAAIARGVIPRLVRCAEIDPSDHEALFLLGVARNEAEHKELALQAFEAALRLNERPEIYAWLGLLKLEAGRTEEGRADLLEAAHFNYFMIRDLVTPALAWELYAAGEERREQLAARKNVRSQP